MTSILAEQPPARPSTDEPIPDDAVATFDGLRARLLGIAYRILGSRTEAEDLVQEVWLRWQGCDRAVVRNPTAFLVTMTTRLALNVVQTARVRREAPAGRWLPEPAGNDDPTDGVEQAEAVEHGLHLLCERLTPAERAAFVLRTAFDYPYHRIAGILRVSEANARQLVSRASRRLACGRRRPVDPGFHRELTRAFSAAARHGSTTALERLLAAETVHPVVVVPTAAGRLPLTDRVAV